MNPTQEKIADVIRKRRLEVEGESEKAVTACKRIAKDLSKIFEEEDKARIKQRLKEDMILTNPKNYFNPEAFEKRCRDGE